MFWIFAATIVTLAVFHSGFRRFLLICAGFVLVVAFVINFTGTRNTPGQTVQTQNVPAVTGDKDMDVVILQMQCQQMKAEKIAFDPDYWLNCI